MKIQIVVTDACIFIDLYDINLITHFFKLDLEIHTTFSVFAELNDDQQQTLNNQNTFGKLIVHNLQESDFTEISSQNYPKSLSQADKSVLHIANRLNACVLSSDKVLRNCARNKNIEYHGMLWIFDNLISTSLITKEEASSKLKKLVEINFVYRNNTQLISEIEKRHKLWAKS